MTSNLLAGILSRLDMVVFERVAEGVFIRVAPAQPPSWFHGVWPDPSRNEPVSLAQAFPFLESFLDEAEDVWSEAGDRRLRSDPFIVQDRAGGDRTLVASAVSIDRRSFVVLESPGDSEERRRTLQGARDHALAHEEHVRRTGELLVPVRAAQQLVQQIAIASLPVEQQNQVNAVRDRLAAIAEAIEKLTPLPKGVSRGRR